MPDSALDLLLTALRDLLIERGIAVAKPSDSFVALAKLPLDIHVYDVTILQESAKLNAISAVFDARARRATENGVCVLAMGYGDNADACAREAARQWVTGVFPVIQSWLTRAEHAPTVTKSEMIVSVAETSQQFGWSVHLGPILYRVYGPPSRKYAPPEVDSNDVLQAVFNAVHPFAAHDTVFWLECFAARYPDGKVDATARLHSEDWPEGKAALLAWAAQWPDTEGCILSRRQFLMFEPVAIQQNPSLVSLRQELDAHTDQKRPWWKRLM